MNLAASPEGNGTERSQGLCFVRARVCVIGTPSGHNLESAGFDASERWGWGWGWREDLHWRLISQRL